MRLIFHGQLRHLFGESITMNSPTVADALEGMSRQVDWPTSMLVSIPNYDSDEALYSPTEDKEVHVMPALAGGGGNFAKIVIGTILIVVGAVFLGGFTNPLGTAFIINGALLVLQGIVGFFLKAPKNKNTKDPDASKYLSVNKNTTAVDTPITLAWGRIDLAGHWLSLQSDSNNLSVGLFPTNPT